MSNAAAFLLLPILIAIVGATLISVRHDQGRRVSIDFDRWWSEHFTPNEDGHLTGHHYAERFHIIDPYHLNQDHQPRSTNP